MTDPQTTHLQPLLDRWQHGDQAARDELIHLSCKRLVKLTRKMLKGYSRLRQFEETDDVLQSALLRLFRAMEAAPPRTVRDFFGLAALNIRRELIDLARHYFGPQGAGANQATPTPPRDDSQGSPPPAYDKAESTNDPDRLVSWGEFHEQVELLPPEEREVFDLLWYQGLEQAEAAAILETSERTVRRRWQAARLRLHEKLQGSLPG
ncbi:MAG TPA: sigma-70 family RNA polymerase sigma factor [Gemmataceae bacterium]|nr:sigma-70 family RNA polymerase sigma factor [Gemmataceae bacterium]